MSFICLETPNPDCRKPETLVRLGIYWRLLPLLRSPPLMMNSFEDGGWGLTGVDDGIIGKEVKNMALVIETGVVYALDAFVARQIGSIKGDSKG